MEGSLPHGRRNRRAWLVFALFVALPALALAAAGLRAISADDIERGGAQRRHAEFIARDAGDALQAALSRVTTLARSASAPSGLTLFQRDPDGTVSFPQHRVFVADFGVIPASVSSSDSRRLPGSVPDVIVSAIATASVKIQKQALEQLRAGTWWLHLDQRRAYDTELSKRLIAAGATDVEASDRRLQSLAQAQSLLTPALAGTPGRASSVQTPGGTSLVVWPREAMAEGSMAGLLIAPAETTALIREALAGVIADEAMAAEVRDGRSVEVWRLNERPVPSGAVVQPLSAVDGWTLHIAPAVTASGRSWWVYGLVGLPIALLAFGLVLTSRVVRREVALARRQAEFTAAVTHEFKSPITSLRLLMERIASGRVAGGSALTEYHDAITRETNRLDALVNRLLDAQQIQAGRRSHSPALEPIGPVIAASVDRFRTQAAEKQIDLRAHVPEVPIELLFDRHSVSDALDNLLDNAIKYSPAGTAVTITAEPAEGQLAITVRDQGAGIHDDDLPHVIEPYYRGRLGDRENVRGTGLGLALVQAAATAHGGSVDVKSAPGKGSAFTLRLPLGGST